MGSVVPTISKKFLNKNTSVNVGSEGEDFFFVKAVEFNGGTRLGQPNSQYTFEISAQDQWVDYQSLEHQMIIKVMDNNNGGDPVAYAAGTPIALVPDVGSMMCAQYQTYVNDVQLDFATNYNNIGAFQRNMADASQSWVANTPNSSNLWQTDSMIYDEPGFTQDTTITGPTSFPGVGNEGFFRIAATTGVTGASIELTANSNGVSGAVISNATVTGAIGIREMNTNRSFWKRQSMTDGSKLCLLRIPLSKYTDSNSELSGWRHYLKGNKITHRINTNLSLVNNMLQRAAFVNPGCIVVYDWWVRYRVVKPSMATLNQLLSEYKLGNTYSAKYIRKRTTPYSTIGVGDSQVSISVNFLAEGRPLFFFVSFIPSDSVGDQTANINCSLVPAPPVGTNTGNPISQAFITYGGAQHPNIAYGQYNSDLMREWYAFVYNACGRESSNEFAPAISFQQWLQNYFYLVFDLRSDNTPLTSANGGVGNLTVNFANSAGFTVKTQVYITVFYEYLFNVQYIGNTVGEMRQVISV